MLDTQDTLDKIGFDSPFMFNGQDVFFPGSIPDTPEVYVEERGIFQYDGPFIDPGAWGIVAGHSNQYGYDGGIMHASEMLTHDMMKAVHSELGSGHVYAMVVVESYDVDGNMEDEPAGWALVAGRYSY